MPDLPLLTPTADQLAWQQRRLGLFFHVGVNTYFGQEWSDGTLPASAFDPTELDLGNEDDMQTLRRELKAPGPERLFYVADGFRAGMSVEEIHALSFIDPWFLDRIEEGGFRAVRA